MLLDTYVLRKGFEDLLTIASPAGTPPPQSYLKRVAQSTARLSPLLKTLQVRPSPPEALVQAYLIHIADKSDANFKKLLELKGIARKSDQAPLIDLFHAHRAHPRHDSLPLSNPVLTPFVIHASGGGVVGGGVSGAGSGGLGSLSVAANASASNLPNRFDPAMLGNAIMSAARDGVDRLGGSSSPALPGAGTPAPLPPSSHQNMQHQQSYQPQQQSQSQHQLQSQASTNTNATDATTTSAGNLNENLRSIGKFFKRDMGGFGSRFGTATRGAEDG